MDPSNFWFVGVYLFFTSFFVSLLMGTWCIRLATQWGLVDLPGLRKLHSVPIPLSGGLQIFFTMVIILSLNCLLCWMYVDGLIEVPFFTDRIRNFYAPNILEQSSIALSITGGMLIVFLAGLLDDAKGVSVKFRLALQVLAALCIIASGIQPEFWGLPAWVIWPVALLWIVGITNAFNLIDGMDGLSSGVGLIASFLFMLAMTMGNQPLVAMFYVMFIGVLLGFFVFNFPKAQCFLGSSGALLIGFLISVTVLMSTFNINAHRGEQNFLPVFMPVIILIIPLYDMITVMYFRYLRKRPLTKGDQNHLSHRLLRMGFTRKQVVLLIFLISFSFGLSALLLISASNIESVILIFQIFTLSCLLLIMERRVNKRRAPRVYQVIKAKINCASVRGIDFTITDISENGVGGFMKEADLKSMKFPPQDIVDFLKAANSTLVLSDLNSGLSIRYVWAKKVSDRWKFGFELIGHDSQHGELRQIIGAYL